MSDDARALVAHDGVRIGPFLYATPRRPAERHSALLVADDAVAARSGELIRSLGHTYRHADNQEDAYEQLDQQAFCYAVVDLQIRVGPDSSVPTVEAGHHLIEQIRGRYPMKSPGGHLEEGHFYFPIFAMGAVGIRDVVRAFNSDATDFLLEPWSENVPPVGAKVQRALRRAGRSTHDACALMTAKAFGADGVPHKTIEIAVTGRIHRRRSAIEVDGVELLLTNLSFCVLATLAVARLCGSGWIYRDELGGREGSSLQTISRLRQELASALPAGTDAIENDEQGSYRLCGQVLITSINWHALALHADHRMRTLAAQASG